MEAGDLVVEVISNSNRIGIILSIVRSKENPPDYRRQDQYSVYWGLDVDVGWYHRNELRCIYESR